MKSILFMCVALIVYFLPSMVAHDRKHHNKEAIFLLNLLLGWTVLGWVIAAIWAVTKDKQEGSK